MHKKNSIGLNLCLTLYIFFIISVTMILCTVIILGLIRFGLIDQPFFNDPLAGILLILAILSIAISTALAPFIAHFPLRPLRRLIAAIDGLAEGDFKQRIHMEYPPELLHLSESFNSMASQLESMQMLGNDFIHNFSHEFKTPIVSIKGFAKLLKNNDLTEGQRQEYLDIIIHESDRLATMAAKILDLSKLEGQTELTQITTYNLAEQIRLAFLVLENKWSSKNIDFSIELEEIKISANKEMMEQVFVNLLDNAIKFTPDGGFISMSLTSDNDKICFILQDSGIGMDEGTVSHIFHKFYQADNSHQQEGNGLGLTLVKQIIDLHKGDILIDSAKGKGTKITLVLPCYR
ncbi:MAG: HAMP domain-containing sensor histidine kinase [Lachnospiraceae bacterium]|nr:HAMP domain-containing sensor histidine kinase [Lachnospiraceae bacterium]